MGQIYVSQHGFPETLFAEGAQGSVVANWIATDVVYTFRLYAGRERERVLANVVVKRGNQTLETLSDVLILSLLVAPVVLVARAAYRAYSQHCRSSQTARLVRLLGTGS